MSNFVWLEPRVDYLKSLFADGLSGSEMADAINVRFETAITRCAVLGKLKRIGLQHRGGQTRPKSGPKPKSPTVARRARFVPPFVGEPPTQKTHLAPVSAPLCASIGLMELTNETCRWPEGTGPYRFCGALEADISKGVPYCRWHSSMAYHRPGEREEAA